MNHILRIFPVFIMAFVFVVVTACAYFSGDVPSKLRVAVLPDQSAELLHQQHDPLISYLGDNLKMPVELSIPKDYAELSRWFDEGKVDMAYFGGLTYAKAHQKSAAQPLVMRDIDERFTTVFLASKANAGKTLADFKGARFSFGSNQSTSGHLMPRYFLEQQDIFPETHFSQVSFSGAHDKTIELIGSGAVELGAVNSAVVDRVFAQGKYKREDFFVVWLTPPYADYVWAVRPGLSDDFRKRLMSSFLTLSTQDENQALVLSSQSAKAFLPVRADAFEKLEAVAMRLGLLGNS